MNNRKKDTQYLVSSSNKGISRNKSEMIELLKKNIISHNALGKMLSKQIDTYLLWKRTIL